MSTTSITTGLEHVDVLIVGARHLRYRGGVLPADRATGQVVRDSGGSRRNRRNLGPVPLSRHPLRFGPAHLQL